MAWVRYDDQFHAHPKVTAVIAENPAALALHVLANTWTNGQKRMGFIPKHQPGVLVCDRSQGAEWADVLVRHGLWHETGNECEACREEYADLPEDASGFVIHNAKEYRAPARDRLTPGTAAELSEKRREAGRRGGLASAAKRNRTNASTGKQNEANNQASQAEQAKPATSAAKRAVAAAASEGASMQVDEVIERPAETHQSAQAGQANGVSKTSNLLLAGVSPEPVPEPLLASNEARVPPSAGTAPPRRDPSKPINAGDIIAAYMDGAKAGQQPRPSEKLRNRVGRDANRLLTESNDPEQLRHSAFRMGAGGWQDLDVQVQRDAATAKSRDLPRAMSGARAYTPTAEELEQTEIDI